MKRGQSGISCLLIVDKPSGMSSHDVVNRVRRACGEGRVGHCGTLDPMASGLLIVGLGPAARLSDFLIGHDKRYRARICFGYATDTDDREGRIIECCQPSAELSQPEYAQRVLTSFLGEQMQLPPAYSAIKLNGKKAYDLARSGKDVALEPRPITVYASDLVSIQTDAGPEGLPCVHWDVDFHVSKGSYIRALARDIGISCSSCAHLSALRRCHCGSADISAACSLEQIEDAGSGIVSLACDPVALLGFAVFGVTEDDYARIFQGQFFPAPDNAEEGQLFSLCSEDSLRAVYECRGGRLMPKSVFPQGIHRGAVR